MPYSDTALIAPVLAVEFLLPLLGQDLLLGGILSIFVLDGISSESFCEFVRAVEEGSGPVRIVLNCGGGDDIAALAYADYIRLARKSSGRKFLIEVFGQASSAAVLLLACCDIRRMGASAWVMVHESQDKPPKGSTTALEVEVEQMRRKEKQWCKLLAGYTKATEGHWASLHTETTYLTPEECLELGLIDEII